MAVDIDVKGLSKIELRNLMRKGNQRLKRLERRVSKATLKSSDPRVVAVADRIRELSAELGMKRRDVFAAVAGNMRVGLASPERVGSAVLGVGEDKSAVQARRAAADSAQQQGPASTAKAAKVASSRGKKAKSTAAIGGAPKTSKPKPKKATKRGKAGAKRTGAN
ncbi:MAG TPA: hypothetical protein VFA48_14015 [Gammaproteobacteria bacterium]|nr:hypothetical protein [Gammaproteobacteria bacterium]